MCSTVTHMQSTSSRLLKATVMHSFLKQDELLALAKSFLIVFNIPFEKSVMPFPEILPLPTTSINIGVISGSHRSLSEGKTALKLE